MIIFLNTVLSSTQQTKNIIIKMLNTQAFLINGTIIISSTKFHLSILIFTDTDIKSAIEKNIKDSNIDRRTDHNIDQHR